ncbi:MAG: BACON domain-containing protein [Bacteroidales bacterium]|nr:BACON domain-containing protein [Bacteroidales bacterium]
MRNRISIILLAACVLGLLSSCAEEPMISLSKTSVSASNEAAEIALDVNTTYDWTASSSAGWVKLSPSSGAKGLTKVTVNLDVNNTFDDRSATVTFSSEGITSQLTISQSQKNSLVVSTGSYHLSFEADTIDVKLMANVDYSYSIPDTAKWVKVIETKALKESHILFQIDENEGFSLRETAITFTDKSKGLSTSVKIQQDPQIHFEMDADSLAIAYDDTLFVLKIRTNGEFRWNASGCTWLDCSDQLEFIPGEMREYELHFTAESNPAHSFREYTVPFMDANKVRYKLYVRQEAAPYVLTAVAAGLEVTAPVVKETSDDALIDWGDGSVEAYSVGLTHRYSTEGPHTITIKSAYASRVNLGSIRGIERMDFRLF